MKSQRTPLNNHQVEKFVNNVNYMAKIYMESLNSMVCWAIS